MPLEHPTGTAARQTMTVPTTESIEHAAARKGRPQDTSGWLERIESMIERYPWPTALFALAVGYVLSRRMR